MATIINLPGYQIQKQIYQGTRTVVYQGIRISDQQAVVIKLLRNESPNFNEILQFRNQYTITKNFDFPSIIKTLNLEYYSNGYALVIEDFGGISLSNYLNLATKTDIKTSKNYKNLPLPEFFNIAIQLIETLSYLYENRVIHKDIKPANILINPHTKQVKLIDFSISSLLPKETQEIQNPNILEGTLAYLSPEQTGRMNRSIDYRSDFYSLGVTFYEILTGTLPFLSEEAIELVYCHLAKQPIPIHEINSQIPPIISKIVSKLMAKNADDRYQSVLGIKHDLEKCLIQLQTTGQIEDFELAQGDISDRFIIPEKLYGRETEVNQLLESFDRVSLGATEIMLVAGYSGIGKTAFVNEVHKPIVRQKGYFIKGKYDQFHRNIPLSAFLQAFRDLIKQLLSESDAKIQFWQTQILTALGDNGQILIDVIPELENIIGKQLPPIELSGAAAQNRFNLLFYKFAQIFTIKEHPLVIFLDDLQWADSASLNLLKLLMQESGYLLILGAYRDNEVSPVHPLILTIDELIKTGLIVNKITLPPLKETDINCLIADTLNCELSLAEPLTKLVYQKTKGNPFFTTQFLKALYNDQLIKFIPPQSSWNQGESQGGWQCDITKVEALALTDDVVELMARQLQKLPRETQDILKLAACIGAKFDLNTLAIVSKQTQLITAIALDSALQEGLVIPTTKIYKFFTQCDSNEVVNVADNPTYRFLHDRVQQAAYSLIPEDKIKVTHLKIGQLLQQNLSEIEKAEKLFDIVGHFNLGIELITELKDQEKIAQLNLAAARKARNATAYNATKIYLQTGLALLTKNSWQNQYKLTLNLYIAATESAYLNGEFTEMEQKAEQVLKLAQTILDKVKIYEVKISALTAQSQMLEAIAVGNNALIELGVDFSSEPDDNLTKKALQNITDRLQNQPIEDLINLPVMQDKKIIAALKILARMFAPIFIGKPALLDLLCVTIVNLSLQFGNAPASIIGYVGYGMVRSALFGEVEKGYCFGQLALSLLYRLNAREFKCLTLLWFGVFLQHRQESLRATIPTAKEGYLAGMETGDFLYAGYNITNYFLYNFLAGVYLEDWQPEIENYCSVFATVKQESPVIYLQMKKQMVHHLMHSVKQPDLLIGSDYDETVMIPKHQQDNQLNSLAFVYIYKMILAYIFGNYNNALDYTNQANIYLMAVAGTFFIPVFHFYAGLIYLAIGSQQSEIEQANTLALVENHQNILAEWAQHTPMNHQHKVNLLVAEKCRILGKNYEAGDWYDRAISLAKENEYLQEEALANELAAKFYLTWGKEKVAAGYMQEAYYCYARWGAKAKIVYLEQNYSQLLGAILQPNNLPIKSGATITMLIKNLNNTSSQENIWLDFPAVIKSSQALSEEIELEKLLASLLKIAMENAGAQKGNLILYDNQQWVVMVNGNLTQIEKLAIPLDKYQEIPQSLIYSVARSQTTKVFDNLSLSPQFAGDRYITTHQPKSVLSTPILRQGKLIGILYLENNLIIGAFTKDRLEILQMLTNQAAISLENAHLYQQVQNYSQTLETEVQRKTLSLHQKAQDLEQTLQKLQQTQAQLIHSEKMSSLGQLVAGIAHEINNPINFIHGNIIHTKDYVENLIDLINLYEQEYPQHSPVIQAKSEEIDLHFLISDLTKVLNSMQTGSDRINQIVQSLRNFSRLDEADYKEVDLHSGIDSTLLILQHRLKKDDQERDIKIIKEYGQIPLVKCYPSALNQVFMNILNNAIDALQKTPKNSDNISKKPTIIIKTFTENSQNLIISIADNGMGIEPLIIAKIFDPFFTTKPVGKGTGLGLSISYSIIVEKHHGELTCYSTHGQGTEFIIKLPI